MNTYLASSRFSTHYTRRGFTLIEMMIVVAVIGILAAIAWPSYIDYIRKSRRVDAKNALLDMAARQERFFSINNTYTDSAAALGYSALPQAVNSSGTSYYSLNVSVTAATATALPTFTATATPTGSQTSDVACYAYKLTQLGVQTNTSSTNGAVTGANCW